MTRSSAVNESLAYVKGFCPYSEPIIEQYIDKLEKRLEKAQSFISRIIESHHISEVDWEAMREAEQWIKEIGE